MAVGVFCALSLSAVASARGWVKDPGAAYLKVSAGAFTAEASEEGQGLRYVDRSARLYAEVGVLEGLHVVTDTAFVAAANEDVDTDERFAHSGWGDLRLGLRWRLSAEPVALAAGLDVKTPLYEDVDQVAQGLAPQDVVSFPDLGDGGVDVSAGIGAGLSLHPLPMWVGAWAAYQRRGAGFGDTALLALDGGGVVGGLVGLGVVVDAALAWIDDEVTKSYVSVGAQTWLELGWPVTPELYVATLPWVRNTEKGATALVGVSWKR